MNSIGVPVFSPETCYDKKAIIIYPNPATEKVSVRLADGTGEVSLKIFNVSGLLVKSARIHANTQIPCNTWPEGIYFLLFEQDGKRQVERVVVR